jgi:hypothetical protein
MNIPLISFLSFLLASVSTPSPSTLGPPRSYTNATRRPSLARTWQRLQRCDQRKSRLKRYPLSTRPGRPLCSPTSRSTRCPRRHSHPSGERTLSHSRRRGHQCPQTHKRFLEEGEKATGLRRSGGPGSHRAKRVASGSLPIHPFKTRPRLPDNSFPFPPFVLCTLSNSLPVRRTSNSKTRSWPIWKCSSQRGRFAAPRMSCQMTKISPSSESSSNVKPSTSRTTPGYEICPPETSISRSFPLASTSIVLRHLKTPAHQHHSLTTPPAY